jgi:DNA repair protein RecO (recombination protein O)
MPSLTVEGLILKRANFGEADRMITILTKNLGKISVVARGVSSITSRRAGNVELLNLVKIGLHKGKGYTLTEAESIETFPRIKSNLATSTAAFHILELTNKLLPEDDVNFRAYDLVVSTLRKLEDNPRQLLLRKS